MPAQRMGLTSTLSHWYRGAKAYDGPPPCVVIATLWWPTSDPRPTERWWL